MANKEKDADAAAKNADIRKAYKEDRKQRPAHLIDIWEQRQKEKMQKEVVTAVQAGDAQTALDRLKELGYGPDSREYKAIIALLYPSGGKR